MDSPYVCWPPKVTNEQTDHLVSTALDYAHANSLVVRTLNDENTNTTTMNAPFSLFPSLFPKRLYDQAEDLQVIYNELYAKVTNDHEFLESVIGGSVIKVDSFQQKLWDVYNTVKNSGVKHKYTLGLFRSDYLLHSPEGNYSVTSDQVELKQVELNTISSSFGPLACAVGDLHKFVLKTLAYPSAFPVPSGALPPNKALEELSKGLAKAHELYGNPSAYVLVVVQPGERNAFDQRALEFKLMDHDVGTLRLTFEEIKKYATIDKNNDSKLILNNVPFMKNKQVEVSVVYYRAGYTPDDYPSQDEWDTRTLLELSSAIKCPTAALQLAGAKKVQQVLARPGELEKFLPSFKAEKLRSTFTRLFPMDDSKDGKEAMDLIKQSNGRGFVLKPQREGGGNNIYEEDIPGFIEEMDKRDAAKSSDQTKEREGYILMDLIVPPKQQNNILVKKGSCKGVEADVMSELGVYGVIIWDEKNNTFANQSAGHLLRTKASDVHEGGVATGFSVIDSPLLV